jgi:S-adenosylmethionine synthetase
VECAWFDEKFLVGGETNGKFKLSEITAIVEHVLYEELLCDKWLSIEILLHSQSAEIQDIVKKVGTGDNGIFFGGWDKVWSPIVFNLKKVAAKLSPKLLKSFGYKSDGKFIATYNDDATLKSFTINIASWEKHNAVGLKNEMSKLLNSKNIILNPKGDWELCWGFADSGLTGRKLAADSQCGLFHHGGGAWFGKNEQKADRSIAIYLTLLAKQIGDIELSASTIIGDETVEINGPNYNKKVKFAEIIKIAKQNPINIFGDFN